MKQILRLRKTLFVVLLFCLWCGTLCAQPCPTADAGPDQNICANSDTLVGNVPFSGFGTWTLISSPGGVNPFIVTQGNLGLASGMFIPGCYVFRYTISSGGCSPSIDEVTVCVNAPPTPANAGPDQNICAYSDTLVGNIPFSGFGLWTYIHGPAGGNPSIITQGNLGIASNMGFPGCYVFRYTISSGGCPSVFDEVTVCVAAPPTSFAGPDQYICMSFTTLSNDIQGGDVVNYRFISGPPGGLPLVLNTGLATQIANMAVPGCYIFVQDVTRFSCNMTAYDTVQVCVHDLPPPANAGPDQQACGDTANLTGNMPPPGVTGTWTFTGNGPAGTAIAIPTGPNTAHVIGMSTPGCWTFRYQLDIPNYGCAANFDDVTICNAFPTVANAGPDQNICTQSATLTGNAPPPGAAAVWTFITGPAAASVAPNGAVSGMNLPGCYTFRWTISQPPCAPVFDEVQVCVGLPPTANAGPDQPICDTFTDLPNFLPGTEGDGATYLPLYGPLTPTLTDMGQSTHISGMTAVGCYGFVLIKTQSNCAATATDTVEVCVGLAGVHASAGPDRDVCSYSIPLAGVLPGGTGTWTVLTGAGSFDNPNDPTTFVRGLQPGLNRFVWSVTGNQCAPGPESDTVTITYNPQTPPVVAPPQVTLCKGTFGTLGVQPPQSGQYYWYDAPIGGTLLGNGAAFTVPTEETGSRAYWLEQVLNGCTTARAPGLATIWALAAPDAFPPANVCEGQPATLFARTPDNGHFYWYAAANGGASLNPPPGLAVNTPFLTPPVTQNNTCYYLEYADDSGCRSDRAAVCLPFTPAPPTPTPAASAMHVCPNTDVFLRVTTPNGPYRFWWYDENMTQIAANLAFPALKLVRPTQQGIRTFYVQARTNNGCAGALVPIEIRVGNSLAAVASNDTVCSGSNGGLLQLQYYIGSIVRWEKSTDNGVSWTTIVNNTPEQAYSNLTQTTLFRAVVTGCSATTTSIPAKITVQANGLNVDMVALRRRSCAQNADGGFTLNIPNGLEPLEVNINNGGFVPTGRDIIRDNLAGGIYAVTVRDAAGCTGMRQITIDTRPDSLTISAQSVATSCVGGANGHIIAVVAGGDAPYLYEIIGGENRISANLTEDFGGLSASNYTLRVTDANGCMQTRLVSVAAGPQAVAVSVPQMTPATCPNSTDGAISIHVLGGQGPYRVSNGGCQNFTLIAQPDYIFSNLAPAVYALCVRDANGCLATLNAQVFATNLPPFGGEVTGVEDTICGQDYPYALTLVNYSGEILYWEESPNHFASAQRINQTQPVYNPQTLTRTTCFRAIVRSCDMTTYSADYCVEVYDAASPGVVTANPPSVCAGGASTLTLSGQNGTVLRWEQSTNNGAAWTAIPGTAGQPVYNAPSIVQETMFRAVLGGGQCAEAFSAPDTVAVTPQANAGLLLRDTTWCGVNNQGVLTLTNYIGQILRWESSWDCFATQMPINHSLPSLAYVNLTRTSCYRAIVSSQGCPPVFSNIVQITVNNTQAVLTPSQTQVCAGNNSGQIVLTTNANVIAWESSTDNWVTVTTLQTQTPVFPYANLTQTTRYRPVLTLGPCVSTPVEAVVTVLPAANGGAAVTLQQTVCAGTPNIVFTDIGYSGQIIGWEIGLDANFTSSQFINQPTPDYTLPVAAQEVWVRALAQVGACAPAFGQPAHLQTFDCDTCRASLSIDTLLTLQDGFILGWETIFNATGYQLEYRQEGAFQWQSMQIVPSPPLMLTGLVPGTRYEFRVRTLCGSEFSEYSLIFVFQTPGEGCAPPDIQFIDPQLTGTTIFWGMVASATDYEVRYRLVGDINWQSQFSNTSFLTVYGLQIGATYEVQVRALCGALTSPFGTLRNFTTPLDCHTIISSFAAPTAGCGLSTGQIYVYVYPPSGQYRVVANGTPGVWQTIPGFTINQSGLAAGYYYVETRLTPGGCVIRSQDLFVNDLGGVVLANIQRQNPNNAGCNNGALTLTPAQPDPTVIYMYSTNGGLTWSLPTPTPFWTGLAPGEYVIRMRRGTPGQYCYSNAGVYRLECFQVREELAADLTSALRVYPNPNHGLFTVAFQASTAQTAALKVLDVTGRAVFEQNIATTAGANEVAVQLSDAAEGVYLLELHLDGERRVFKLVVR